MSTTIREQITAAIETRLADMRTANGYRTECGANVRKALPKIDPDELPASVLWPKVETVERSYGENHCTMPVDIEAISLHGSNDPVSVSEAMLADLIECMTGNLWTLSFNAGVTEIRQGDTITGATSGAAGYVISVSVTSGSWAGDNAAGTITLRRVRGEFQAENLKVSGAVVAASTGAPTGQSASAGMGSLIDDIAYMRGGTDSYPQPGEISTGCQATFNILYRTLAGDPYHQPN